MPRPLPPIHCLCNRGDESESLFREVPAGLHEAEDDRKLLEIELFRGSQWTFFEERQDTFHEIAAPLHGEAKHRLAVVVLAVVHDDCPAPEHLTEEFERRPRCGGLRDRELVLDLPARTAQRVTHHRDREAPFAVDEADGPLVSTWPFLLVVRTARVVTHRRFTVRRWCDNEYRRILGFSSI